MKQITSTTQAVLSNGLNWLICIGLALVSQLLLLPFAKYTGESTGGFLVSYDIYSMNPLFMLLGAGLGIGGFVYILQKRMSTPIRYMVQNGKSPVAIGQAIFGSIGSFIIVFIAMLIIEDFSRRTFRPTFMEYYPFWYPCLTLILSLIAPAMMKTECIGGTEHE